MARTYDVRIAAKHDTATNWAAIEDTFVPMNGEVIVYHDAPTPFDENGNLTLSGRTIKLKIGDGVKRLGELDFLYVGLERALLSHLMNEINHVTIAEKIKIAQSVVAYTMKNGDAANSFTAVYSTDLLPENYNGD